MQKPLNRHPRFMTVILMLTLLLAACGGSTPTDKTKNARQETTTPISQTAADEQRLETEIFKVPAQDIHVIVPAGYIRSSKGSTTLFKKPSMETFIAVVAVSYEQGNAKTLAEAHAISEEYFVRETNVGGGIRKLHVAQNAVEVVSGIELYRFVGELEYKVGDEKAFAVGFSFMIDDVPCMVIGGVLNGEPQSDRYKEEVTDIVDAAVQALRGR